MRVLHILLGLLGAAGTLGASEPDGRSVEPSRQAVVCPDDGALPPEEPAPHPDLAFQHVQAPGSSLGLEESSASTGSAGPPCGRSRPSPRDARQSMPAPSGAFRPGERPPALAYLLVNGSANANGARARSESA